MKKLYSNYPLKLNFVRLNNLRNSNFKWNAKWKALELTEEEVKEVGSVVSADLWLM